MKPRSRRSELLIYIISFVCFSVSVVYSVQAQLTHISRAFVLISVLVPLRFIVELGYRIADLVEEYRHLVSRYDRKYSTLFKDVFFFASYDYILTICSLFTFIIVYIVHNEMPCKLWYDSGSVSVISSVLCILFLQRNLHLKCGSLYISRRIENSNGLDYGSGMAQSFFHGYLRLTIPKTGDQEKNLEELMKDYEDTHGIKFDFYKLFILIPKSSNCPISLMDKTNSPSIEESSSLSPKVLTVAGVQKRVYKHSVYKIVSEWGRRIYISAEYATPLKTFKDVVDSNGEYSYQYKKHKHEIVHKFYLTLKKVLKEHPECTDFCELIYFDDKDENGRYKDVGQILQQRIKKLQKKKRKDE